VIEEWRAIPGFEGAYEVSDLGNVRSVDRWVTFVRRGRQVSLFYKSQTLARAPHPGGYVLVHLYKDQVRKALTVHKAVMAAFVGPRPAGLEILHGDDDKANCRLDNLKYGTRAQNIAEAVERGTTARGERSAQAKLTATEVLEIRRRAGEPQEHLAQEFGCTFSNISAIQLRKSWRHV
jgi:hypothetical protein